MQRDCLSCANAFDIKNWQKGLERYLCETCKCVIRDDGKNMLLIDEFKAISLLLGFHGPVLKMSQVAKTMHMTISQLQQLKFKVISCMNKYSQGQDS